MKVTALSWGWNTSDDYCWIVVRVTPGFWRSLIGDEEREYHCHRGGVHGTEWVDYDAPGGAPPPVYAECERVRLERIEPARRRQREEIEKRANL